VGGTGSSSGNYLCQFGLGPAGSEIPLCTVPLKNRSALGRSGPWNFWLPLAIPAGLRIAYRTYRASSASVTTRGLMIGLTGPSGYLPPFHRLTEYGIDLANARGTSVDPGATPGTQGARTTIIASTTRPIKLLYILCSRLSDAAAVTSQRSSVQLFLGAAGPAITPEEPAWALDATGDWDAHNGLLGPYFVNLPAGVDIRAAARGTDATVGERESQVMLWGLD
jgi:hypothetical protein